MTFAIRKTQGRNWWKIPNPYDGQGIEQPFGYIGYRCDEWSGNCFAQMRKYQLKLGRFIAEDVAKGDYISEHPKIL